MGLLFLCVVVPLRVWLLWLSAAAHTLAFGLEPGVPSSHPALAVPGTCPKRAWWGLKPARAGWGATR